jgi:TPR repeat protein
MRSLMCGADGEGVTQDYGKALQYYLAATEGGNLVAHFNLAQMHRFGVGANRNCHVGVSLYKKRTHARTHASSCPHRPLSLCRACVRAGGH